MAGKPTWKDLKRYFLEQGDDRENEEFAELIVNLTGHNPEKDSRRVDLRVQTKQLLSGFPDEEIANWYPPALAEVVISAEPGQDMLKKHVQTLREQLAEAEASAEEAKTNAARLASKLDICTKARKDLQDRIDKLEPALEESERKLRECGRQNETLKGEKQQLTEANTALHNRLDQMGTRRRPEEERETPAFMRRREPIEDQPTARPREYMERPSGGWSPRDLWNLGKMR